MLFFIAKPHLSSLLFLSRKVQFFIAWHKKGCLVYWQLKAWNDQSTSVLKMFRTKCKRMDFSLNKHAVLMIPINFYHFKDLTEDQISLFMADLNQSLFCLAKFQVHIWKLFWELSIPHPRLYLPDQEIPASSLKFTVESPESKTQKTDFCWTVNNHDPLFLP